MSEPIVIPPGSTVWIAPVGTNPPIIVKGVPHSLDDEGVRKWDELGVTK